MRYTEKDREFFLQSADVLAPQLLGKMLCRRLKDGTELRFRITEIEAYCHNDSACCGYKKSNMITDAIAPLFEEGGKCCSFKEMFYIVCNKKGFSDNVLIRSVGCHDQYCSGPRLLGKILDIEDDIHGRDILDENSEIWIEDDGSSRDYCEVERKGMGKRIKEDDRNKKWRFVII